jgi:hypothetical protein
MRAPVGKLTLSDPMTQLFTQALGLQTPWRVEQVRFEPQANAIHFAVACDAKRLPCPRRNTPDQPIHDRLQRDWQHLASSNAAALLHAALPHGMSLEDEAGTARHPGLAPFKRLTKTVQAHIDGIRNRLAAGHSNARAESINAAIQAAIARAHGFRTFEHLRTIIDLTRGSLKLPASPVAGRAT